MEPTEQLSYILSHLSETVDKIEFARSAITPEMRDGDTFKDATIPPPSAGPLERLAALSGRSV